MRYGTNYIQIIEFDFDEFIEQVDYAVKQKTEEYLLNRWVMNYEKQMSFKEFKTHLGYEDSKVNKNIKIKSNEEIMDDVFQIIKMTGGDYH